MQSYLDIVKNILVNGKSKKPTRYENGIAVPVENGTIGLSQVYWEHNMSEGFPLLTCRKMPIRSILVELEGFINGITDKRWYQERKCKYWDHWAHPKAVISNEKYFPSKKETQKNLWDLGPIYGYQWRKFGKRYDSPQIADNCYYNGNLEGHDQLKSIVDTLKSNPYDRRMVCSAWNPDQIWLMALPPCHLLWNVCVYGDELNLHWHQRSCDTLRGIPSNIASYAALMLLLCKESGLKPGKLSAMFMDCHLYDNDVEHAADLLKLETYNLPTLNITSNGIWDWTHKDVELLNYQHGPSIKFNEITV